MEVNVIDDLLSEDELNEVKKAINQVIVVLLGSSRGFRCACQLPAVD